LTAPARQAGTVADFDEQRGTGEVEAPQGGRLFFHCTAIADGTRTIRPGTPVSYLVVPGHLGHWEAGDLRPT
jgi:cold shock CspA family protein